MVVINDNIGRDAIRQSWLLIGGGIGIGLIGVLLLSFTEVNRIALCYGIGASLLVSGVCLVGFSSINRAKEVLVSWVLLNGLLSSAFGVALLVYADASKINFLDLLGFWALVFAILQAAQAIYSYIGPQGSTFDGSTKLIHMLLVVASSGLAFALLMMPGASNPLGMTGLLPLIMGALLNTLVIKSPRKAITVPGKGVAAA